MSNFHSYDFYSSYSSHNANAYDFLNEAINVKTDNTIEETNINVGKYKFRIREMTDSRDGIIRTKNFQIGGNYKDCVNITVEYDLNNNPVSARIPNVVYDDECSFETPLDRGQGTILMVKTILNHIHNKFPTLTEVEFEDMSNIECAIDDEHKTKRTRTQSKQSLTHPTPLYWFSIAFNGQTWYEKHFNAVMKHEHEYIKYRENIDKLLNSVEFKSNETYKIFAHKCRIPTKLDDVLEPFFNNATTFGDFFISIPKQERCRVIRSWIDNFGRNYIPTFKHSGWIIRIPIEVQGGHRRKSHKKYYLPKGRVRRQFTRKDLGADINDI